MLGHREEHHLGRGGCVALWRQALRSHILWQPLPAASPYHICLHVVMLLSLVTNGMMSLNSKGKNPDEDNHVLFLLDHFFELNIQDLSNSGTL